MGTASGNLSLTLTETCTYKVLEYTDQGITLDDGQCTTNVSGGGNAKTSVATYDCKQAGDRKVKCAPISKEESYTCTARPPNGRMTRLSLDPVTGTGGISFTTPSAISKSDSGETSSEGACVVYPGSFSDASDTRETIVAKMDKYNKDLAAAQRFKFNPNDSSFSGGNSFSRSWSSGGPTKAGELMSSGSIKFQYTVSGGAPKDETEVELVPPKEWDQWLPQAGEDQKTIGNFIDVEIVAHKKDDPDSPPPKQVLKYTITLEKTSQEAGVDLNTPAQYSASHATCDYDMRIDETNPWITLSDSTGQSARTKQPNLTDFRVTVNSYDWGGWTQLKVVAELSDHTNVTAHVRGAPQLTLAIPRDGNNNHIADAWEESYALASIEEAADDDDFPVGDSHKGDSIALYDEYRGFHIGGKHERLSPKTKDLFIWDYDKLGAGYYSQSTGVRVHLLSNGETYSDSAGIASGAGANIVTPNGRFEKVHAIWLHNASLGGGVVGDTPGGPSVPANIRAVMIDTAFIASAYKDDQPWAARIATITHELGHATNVFHHGQGQDYDVGAMVCLQPDGSELKKPCTKRGGCFEVAGKGGMYSGNDTCPMRYDMTDFYPDPAGACRLVAGGDKRFSLYGADPPGLGMYCSNAVGTGVNDPSNPHNKAGNATKGRCATQFCLKNGAH
jgi:hypothetical protein